MSFKPALTYTQTASIRSRLASHKMALAQVIAACPYAMQPHIIDCVLQHNKLLIYVDSAVWASQLRFLQDGIKAVLNRNGVIKITQINMRILPPRVSKKRSDKKILPSTTNIHILRQCSEAMELGRLKTSLLKLSSTLEKLQDNN